MVTGAVGDGSGFGPFISVFVKMLLRALGDLLSILGLLIHHPLPEEPVPAHSSNCFLCTDPSRDPTGQPSP